MDLSKTAENYPKLRQNMPKTRQMTPNNTKIWRIMVKFHQTTSNIRVFWADVVEIWDILRGRRPTLPDFGYILHTGPVVFEIPSLENDMITYSMYMYYSIGVEPLDTARILKDTNPT